MTPVDFILFGGDSSPNAPIHSVMTAMKKSLLIFGASSEYEVVGYYFNGENMVLEIQPIEENEDGTNSRDC